MAMWNRLLSAILIPAIVVCPVACGDGCCQAGSCLHATTCEDLCGTAQEETHDGDCCRHGDSPEPSSSEKTPRSPGGETPGAIGCQCICGGAIVEDATDWAPLNGIAFVVPVGDDACLPSTDGRVSRATEIDDLLPDPHFGRYLRALCASLLL